MQSGYLQMPVPDDGLCFNCEQIFSNRRSLEEHRCPVPSFICSCGSEFATYQDMLQHNRSHEPGHQVLCHETIKKQRIEKHSEEEEKLKRLLSGEVIWESPKSKAAAQMVISAKKPQGKVQQHVPPRVSQDLLQNASTTNTGKLFSNIGAPTVDLWTLFQPIVVVDSMRLSSKTNVYICGKCGQTFATRRSLVIHHNTHIADKVLGCIGCGLLLSSRKIVPRFHSCHSSYENKINRFKLITARPLNQITHLANGLGQLPFPAPSLKIQNNFAATKIGKDLNVEYNPSAAKKPFISVQRRALVSNSKFGITNTPPVAHTAAGIVTQTPGKGYECRVCHDYFESINVLQRHKCAKAHEFLLKHKLAAPVNRQRPMVTVQVPGSSFQNSLSNSLRTVPAANNIMKSKVSNVNNDESTVVSDDDCFIVEDGPEKPAEVIYQVTSSVPIKT